MNISPAPLRYVVTVLVILSIGFFFDRVGYCAEAADTNPGDDQESEVQTRGPVHEAFAGVVAYNPEPGVVVPKAPPEAIEEVPPDEKPEGDNVAWIPGYWAWDDERNDFLWLSGVWRALPPGRQWVSGYWAQTTNGYQWTSGYWADARAAETTYLPPPPVSLERGPNIEAPSPDYFWVPGYWVWYQGRYAWRPGYWVAGRPDWEWSPSYYTWTPRGYVFVDGYWDYTVVHRGVLFAPVYYSRPVYLRHGYYYSPSVVIELDVFPEHLFIRPRYHHCYFGDYYAANYYRSGFFASFSFQSRRHGYDPIFSHRRWEHRNDRNWERNVATTYKYRRDHVDARPPRTWTAQASITTSGKSKDRSLAVATSFKELSKRKDSPMRFQPVAKEEKQRIVQRDQEVRQSREERRTLETSAAVKMPAAGQGKANRQIQPSIGKLPKSPIAAVEQPGKELPPPTPRQTQRPSAVVAPKREEPKPEQPKADRDNRQREEPKQKERNKPEAERPGKQDNRPAVQQPQRELPTVIRPSPTRREQPAEVRRPQQPETPPAVQQPPAQRELPTVIKQQPAHIQPMKEKPARREAPPELRQPHRPQPPPPTIAPPPTQSAPAPAQPPPAARENPQGGDKGNGHGNGRGEDQQAPPGR